MHKLTSNWPHSGTELFVIITTLFPAKDNNIQIYICVKSKGLNLSPDPSLKTLV